MPIHHCTICGMVCPGKATTCSPDCRREQQRRNQARHRERLRGGPRLCVVCGAPIIESTSTNTCSFDCHRARRLGVPLERLPPYEPLASKAVCDVCGRLFVPWRPRQKGCSPQCMRTGRLRRKLERNRKGPYPPRPCLVCGESFAPDRKNGRVCPRSECRAQHKRDLAAALYAGQRHNVGDCLIYCIVCGKEAYRPSMSLTCGRRQCVLARRREVDRKTRGILPCSCIVCGERFWPPPGKAGSHYTCSDSCSRIAYLRKQRRTYEAHREERLAEQARRMRDDPEYRARRQELDREYRRRLAEINWLKLQEQLRSKTDDQEHDTRADDDGTGLPDTRSS